MPAAAEGPDTEDLKISPFAKGEWSQDERILLDVSFTSLAAALGDEDDPLESIAVSRLLAIAYAVGWSSKMLMVSPTDFAGELEAAIDARGGLQGVITQHDTFELNRMASCHLLHSDIGGFAWDQFVAMDPVLDCGIAQEDLMSLTETLSQPSLQLGGARCRPASRHIWYNNGEGWDDGGLIAASHPRQPRTSSSTQKRAS